MKSKRFFIFTTVLLLLFLCLSTSYLYAGENRKVKQWINQLSSSRERAAAKKNLIEAGDWATPELIYVLENESVKASTTILIIQIFKINKSQDAIPLIKELASSSRPRIRLESIRALGAIRDEGSADIFKEALKDNKVSIRLSALSSLIEIKEESAVPQYINSLSDPFVGVRLKALQALSLFDDASIKPALLRQLNDTNISVAIKTVGLLSDYKDKEVVGALSEKLDAPNDKLRIKVIEALTKIDDESVLPRLEPMLTDECTGVRKAAKVAINTIGK